MNNKAFGNLFCNPQKSFHTSPTPIIKAVNHSSNSTIAFTTTRTKTKKQKQKNKTKQNKTKQKQKKKKKKTQLVVKFSVNAIIEFVE